MNNKKEYRFNYGGKEVILETGRLAKQADGSVLVSSEGTQVLVTVCSALEIKDGQDFFPLMVDYREKFFSAGKFLGGYMKREARPATHETLNSRLIDRPLRPLFPEGYMAETIIQATVYSYDEKGDPEVLGALGAAAALSISDIPFNGPLGTCKVGRVNGSYTLNPTVEEWKDSDMELVVAASQEAIMMVEGEGDEVSEKDMMEAINFAHENIQDFIKTMEKMTQECGKAKREFVSAESEISLLKKVEESFSSDAREILNIVDKQERTRATAQLNKKVAQAISASPQDYDLSDEDKGLFKKEAYKAVDELLYQMMRNDILKEDKRIGGRKLSQVRPIETEVDLLQKVHGSSLFTRGETQVLAAVTLGGDEGQQYQDKLSGLVKDNFYLHYTFPPFSVGEARGYRGVGRRELGHGNLAERAIRKVLPEKLEYTIRVACEVLESNGSSSMGSVCSASMALMDSGISLKSPVAGVAMGLIKSGDDYKILTDILGDEDHLGDMDFKVAGTAKGITAIQMDIKIAGITQEIFTKALDQANTGRMHILEEMAKTISGAREKMKAGVPQVESIKIATDKIGALIGPGGKNIKGLQEDFQVNINVTEEGLVKIVGTNPEILNDVKNLIGLQIEGPKVNSIYDAVVVSLKDYGAFVDIAPGVSGLVHVSELAEERVNDVNLYVSEGDKVKVKILEVDRFGRPKMSIKAVEPLKKKDS
jgi:polyribonucleotide nucleotidyltransferase